MGAIRACPGFDDPIPSVADLEHGAGNLLLGRDVSFGDIDLGAIVGQLHGVGSVAEDQSIPIDGERVLGPIGDVTGRRLGFADQIVACGKVGKADPPVRVACARYRELPSLQNGGDPVQPLVRQLEARRLPLLDVYARNAFSVDDDGMRTARNGGGGICALFI